MSAIQEWSLERTLCGYIVPSIPEQYRKKGGVLPDPCGQPIHKWIYLPRDYPDKPYATAVCAGHWQVMLIMKNGLGFQTRLEMNQVFDTRDELIAYAIMNG